MDTASSFVAAEVKVKVKVKVKVCVCVCVCACEFLSVVLQAAYRELSLSGLRRLVGRGRRIMPAEFRAESGIFRDCAESSRRSRKSGRMWQSLARRANV